MATSTTAAKTFYDNAYPEQRAQRHYPNEEMIRFLGSTFSHISKEKRKNIHVLDVGCGNGANLWVWAKEGFTAHGIELSDKGVELCREKMDSWNLKASVCQGDMTQMDYPDSSMDVIIDVFSACCLDEEGFGKFLAEVKRILKSGGKFFSFQPSKNSYAYIDYAPAKKIDSSTLKNMLRDTSPFPGLEHPIRFHYPQEYVQWLEKYDLKTTRIEKVSRTYRRMVEYLEFLSVVAEKS